MSTFRFFCSNLLVGTVTHLPDESIDGSPWDIGRLEASAEFENFRPLFDAEQQLLTDAVALEPGLAAEKLFEAAEMIQSHIMGIPVRLEGPDGPLVVTELHIQGDEIHWR